MNENTPRGTNGRLVLWAVAAEPLFLAALAWFLRRSGALPQADIPPDGDFPAIIFAAISLAVIWASFQFASGRFVPRSQAAAAGHSVVPFAQMIVAVALAAAPGVLGFVHYILYAADWALLLFNLCALAAAAGHVIRFASGRP